MEQGEKKELVRVTPEEAGVSSCAVRGFLDQIAADRVHLHSFMMLRGERVFAQGAYAPCRMEDEHILFSMSKSFTSTAVGFAVQEGRLSLSDRVVDFFEEELRSLPEEAVCENMRRMTLRHLITMNTGQTDPEDRLFQDREKDWAVSFLTSPVEKEPGSWFLYNTRATYMLSVIVQKVVGTTMFEYLRPRLFEPLGFSEGIWWETSPQGYNTGGFGLSVTVEDIARFGLFVKGKGCFGGRRLLDAGWFEEATKSWSDSSNTWEGENALGYGYQFWMCRVPGTYRGDGAFGQYCVILPQEDMLFVSTAGQLDMIKIADAFWNHVYADVHGETECRNSSQADGLRSGAGDRAFASPLEERLRTLVLPAFYEEKGICGGKVDVPDAFLGKTFVLEDNPLHILALRFEKPPRGEGCLVELSNGRNRDTFRISEEWTAGALHLDGEDTNLSQYAFREGLYERFHVKGCTRENVLYMDMVFQETSFQDTWEIAFEDGRLHVKIVRNTGFVPADFDGYAYPQPRGGARLGDMAFGEVDP